MTLDLLPGESRGYWKYHTPDKWFRQAKVSGKLNNERALMLFDTGAEVSIIDTTFARKVGCQIDESQRQECVGIGEGTYLTDGRTRIKVTLAGSLVYFFTAWVGSLAGQDAIIGMDFMVPAGLRLDLADGSVCLPDEVRVRLGGRRQLFSDKARSVTTSEFITLEPGQSAEIPTRQLSNDKQKLWVRRGEQWVPTIKKGLGRTHYVRITNVSDQRLVLNRLECVGEWLSGDHIPRRPGYVSVGSNRYNEWQNLAYEATVDQVDSRDEAKDDTPAVERREYSPPTAIARRPDPTAAVFAIRTDPSAHAKASAQPLDCDRGGEDLRETEVYCHEGSELHAEEVEAEMAVLPEVVSDPATVKIEDLQVGDPEVNTEEEINRLRSIIWEKKHLLIGKGNALPPPARGAVCDIDVGNSKPIAQRVRKVAPQYREKVAELIKGLLDAKIIQPSTSPWASPIVVIIKKNGVDIRLCIDYRMVNSLTRLMVYPMPLINDLLEDLDKMLWYCSLDMASGFWVVTMTKRAREISAFITPFGLFEWNRMPFGLKNAPQIYQRLLDNALYGFMKIAKMHDKVEEAGGITDTHQEPKDVFVDGEPDGGEGSSVLGRRSYIDDILIASPSWGELCERVERLLAACDRWNLSISVPKSYWGRRSVEYLGHRVSIDGLEAKPKNLEEIQKLPFPRSLRAMQSFLGSLNYYNRFIEDFAIYAATLYELKEVDFHSQPSNDALKRDPMWNHALEAFETLKKKLTAAPILRHFDEDRQPEVIVYASNWAIAAALVQEYDDVRHPIKFTSRTLKPNEVNYSAAERETLALLRMLDSCFNQLVGRHVRVFTRHTTMAWLLRTPGLQGRLSQWAAILSPWSLEVVRCTKGEDEILGLLAASITPRAEVEAALLDISPRKKPSKSSAMTVPTVEEDEELLVVSFDGSAKTKRGGGAFSAVVWQLPEWKIVDAASDYLADITVNEAEYHGVLLALSLIEDRPKGRVIICGDSNLVIRQLRGEMECKAPGLKLLRQRVLDRLQAWNNHELLHVKRDWNQSADLLAGAALQRGGGTSVQDTADREGLESLNRLKEILKPKVESDIVRIAAVTTRARARKAPQLLEEEVVRQMRIDRIRTAQDEEAWIAHLKQLLKGELRGLGEAEVKAYRLIADQYDLDENDLLYYCPPVKAVDEDRDLLMRLVLPETLHADVLHHYHTSLEGGHQGVGRTYQRVKRHFHWRGLYKSVQAYVNECTDCETGKGKPTIRGRSPGNVQATYPFQIIAMDHIPSLPKSFRGNTELLIWVDLFSGFVIAKASNSRTAQTIAESYESSVFRRFGASEAIRHDREPGFMSDFFKAFNRIVGQKQRATLAYRPQANGTAERMVQTLTRAIKMYVVDENQRDWDEYAERLTFALNTAYDRVRQDTPFYLVHGWDPRSTLEATLAVGSTRRQDAEPRRWRYHMQRHYQSARAQVNDLLATAILERADQNNEEATPHGIEVGTRVWLYLDRVKVGYARKLAHMWHGPFRVAEMIDDHAARLEIAGTEYRLFPIVHVSKLKTVRSSPARPTVELTVAPNDRLDFDEELLPEDSWIGDPQADEYEVTRIVDMRTGRKTRYGRAMREFLVHWKGYDEPSWVDEVDLNCGALLHEFLRGRTSRNRLGAMQSHEAE